MRAAMWQVNIGWITMIGMTFARAVTVVTQLANGAPAAMMLGQALLKTCVLIVLAYFYRKSFWPSLIAMGLWPIGFVFAWVVARPSPLVLAVGILVGAALYLGARGMLQLRALAMPLALGSDQTNTHG